MTFQAFLNNPKGYLSTHEMYIANSPAVLACMRSDTAHALPGGLTRQRWRQRPAGPFPTFVPGAAPAGPKPLGTVLHDTARHLPFVGRKLLQYGLGNTVGDLGLRYLPFNPNHVTYMRIHGAANFVMTGPLTGCTIAAVPGAAGEIWFIHANRNGGGVAGAIADQLQGITDLVTGVLGLAMANVITCTYQNDYDGFGFVFGRLRPNGVWKFYSHATSAGGNTVTRKFGEF